MGLIGLYVKVSASSSLAKSSERSDGDLSEASVSRDELGLVDSLILIRSFTCSRSV